MKLESASSIAKLSIREFQWQGRQSYGEQIVARSWANQESQSGQVSGSTSSTNVVATPMARISRS